MSVSRTIQHELFGSTKLLNIIAPACINFPSSHSKNYHDCCGAGEGIGNRLVPEDILGVHISLACYVHDYMWLHADPTWEYFHASNSVFLSNLLEIIAKESDSKLLQMLRNYRAMTYFNAVDSIGAVIFWNKFNNK